MPYKILSRTGKGISAKFGSVTSTEALQNLQLEKEFEFLKEACSKLREHSDKKILMDISGSMTANEYESLCEEVVSKYRSEVDQKTVAEIDSEFHPDKDAENVDVAFEVVDENDKSFGGIHGIVAANKLFIETLWLSEAVRGKKLGEELVTELEKVAAQKYACTESRVTTTSYQAAWLYDRLKYEKQYMFSVNYKMVHAKSDVDEYGKVKLALEINPRAHDYCFFKKKL